MDDEKFSEVYLKQFFFYVLDSKEVRIVVMLGEIFCDVIFIVCKKINFFGVGFFEF